MIATARELHQQDFAANRDRQILALAREVLSQSKYAALRQLTCRVIDGAIEISGKVSSFYLKQLAQQAMLQLEGVQRVRNLVEVCGETAVLVATRCEAKPQYAAKTHCDPKATDAA